MYIKLPAKASLKINFEGRRGPKTGLQKLPRILSIIYGEY